MLNKNSLAEDIRESMYMSAYNALMSTFKGEVTDEAADKAQEMYNNRTKSRTTKPDFRALQRS